MLSHGGTGRGSPASGAATAARSSLGKGNTPRGGFKILAGEGWVWCVLNASTLLGVRALGRERGGDGSDSREELSLWH